ncbi:adenylyltransferase [Helicobacter didelphidarum]|uniref:Molybdopterin-synthase adenylyltransferase n=1 Tax=Helicobacter didelphidarum TaxID=2040648 RepID=A0A3D8IMZ4_9HELI|nr:HesA/MoeB/ThiF family protein [Helicobacter didelphidarum]RDU66004.1 adenylyltransferase [Helicobacter didelphidarum]
MEEESILKERYLRHILLEDVGEEGQKKLAKAKVLVIGVGGLGSPVCMYLSAAGIGRIGILDYDTVERGNLQRQIIHATSDIGKSKADSARMKMQNINPNIIVDNYFERLNEENAFSIIHNYDFIVDATDNFETKFLVNNTCIQANKPFSHAGVLKHKAQTMTIIPHKSACFACIFENTYTKDMNAIFRSGLLGVTPGIIGCIQASEAIKYFLGIGNLLTNTLLTMDIMAIEFKKTSLQRNPLCPICSLKRENLEDKDSNS